MKPRTDWAAQLAAIRRQFFQGNVWTPDGKTIDDKMEAHWVAELTEYDLRFLKTLRIEA